MRLSFNGNYPMTRDFGVYDPAYSFYPGSRHPGTDWGLPANTQLVAGMTGFVSVFDRDPSIKVGRGKEVVITNGNKQRKTCHMNRIDVKYGDWVKEGQPIGISGYTGYVVDNNGNVGTPAGAHLHDELLIDGKYVRLQDNLKEEGNKMYPNKGDLENFHNRNGWPGHELNPNDIAYWTTGTKNDGWAAGADNVWKDLCYSLTLYDLNKPTPTASILQDKIDKIKEILS